MKQAGTYLIIIIMVDFLNVNGQKTDFIKKYTIPGAAFSVGISLGTAHFLAPDTYSWQKNTISQLGAQNYIFAPVMNSGFLAYGSMVTLYAANDLIRGERNWVTSVPVLIYGTSLTLTGIFSTKPFEQGVSFSPVESGLHGIFAYSAVTGLTGTIIGSIITEENPKKLPLHIAGLGTVLFSSAMFMLDERHKGIWQRTLWIGGITWMTIHYSF